jgi:outer membrane protein assembly factor BamD (BamD/ComL family)
MCIPLFIIFIATLSPIASPVPYQAERLMQAASYEEAIKLYNQALKESPDPQTSANTRCRLIHALLMLEKEQEALSEIEILIADEASLQKTTDPDEILYLHGLILSHLNPKEIKAEESLNRVMKQHPQGSYADRAQSLLATLAFQREDYADAEKKFTELIEKFPQSTLVADALFFASVAAEKQHKDNSIIRGYRQKVTQQYPQSQYADEAYFSTYSPSEYLQGDPIAIRHLQEMGTKYPTSPFLIHAFYLLGLDQKNMRQQDSLLGHMHKLTAAIDAFQEAESHFSSWISKGPHPQKNVDHFLAIYLRALLERAYTNIAIASISKGAKKQIYLEYAIDLLEQTLRDLDNPESTLYTYTNNKKPHSSVREEMEYTLARTHHKANNSIAASELLDRLLKKYQEMRITRGYFLSRVWYDKGLIAMDDHDYNTALDHFAHAEETAKGKVLSVDERLDLWIQKSHCYREMNQLDQAMSTLSQVINEDVISNLRLKAMYLRAQIYALQGRQELAINQLKATANKGGDWGKQAKNKLEKEYGL